MITTRYLRFRATLALAAAAALTLLAGCESTPRYNAAFGDGVRTARSLQIMYPGEWKNRGPVSGMDGKAEQSAMQTYHDSFTTPVNDTTPTPASGSSAAK
jgi:hypothetical protein